MTFVCRSSGLDTRNFDTVAIAILLHKFLNVYPESCFLLWDEKQHIQLIRILQVISSILEHNSQENHGFPGTRFSYQPVNFLSAVDGQKLFRAQD